MLTGCCCQGSVPPDSNEQFHFPFNARKLEFMFPKYSDLSVISDRIPVEAIKIFIEDANAFLSLDKRVLQRSNCWLLIPVLLLVWNIYSAVSDGSIFFWLLSLFSLPSIIMYFIRRKKILQNIGPKVVRLLANKQGPFKVRGLEWELAERKGIPAWLVLKVGVYDPMVAADINNSAYNLIDERLITTGYPLNGIPTQYIAQGHSFYGGNQAIVNSQPIYIMPQQQQIYQRQEYM